MGVEVRLQCARDVVIALCAMAEPSRKKTKIEEIVKASVKAVERSLVGVLNETIDQTPPRQSATYLDLTEGSYHTFIVQLIMHVWRQRVCLDILISL